MVHKEGGEVWSQGWLGWTRRDGGEYITHCPGWLDNFSMFRLDQVFDGTGRIEGSSFTAV